MSHARFFSLDCFFSLFPPIFFKKKFPGGEAEVIVFNIVFYFVARLGPRPKKIWHAVFLGGAIIFQPLDVPEENCQPCQPFSNSCL